MEIEMHFSKETKNKIVYANDDPTTALSSLYVVKGALGEPPPPVIVVRIAPSGA